MLMKALVIYESLYGNTHTIAEAIAEGMGSTTEVAVLPVDDASDELVSSCQLVVMGGPTHMHSMDFSGTRKFGAKAEHDKADGGKEAHELDEAATGESLRHWFHHAPDGEGRSAAAFDTRYDKSPALTGSAAKGIARRLRHHGWSVEQDPTSFFVDTENELVDGELERARAWGERLVFRMSSADRQSTAG